MKISTILNTLFHLRPAQIVYQVKYRLYKPGFVKRHCDGRQLQMLKPICKFTCYDGHQFRFLNTDSAFCGWNDTSKGRLWAYNLNYMDWLLQDGFSVKDGLYWIKKFIDEFETNSVGSDPYPIALRGINWIKFMSINREFISGEELKTIDDSLYSQYLLLTKKLEYHLMGNHLLEDAYSLFIAAIYFGKTDWFRRYSKLLKTQLDEQILSDGAHYEQSPMYHCIMLERLLDCYNFSTANIFFEGQNEVNAYIKHKAGQMLGHLESIIYRDGTIPMLNDSAENISASSAAIFEYAGNLGLSWNKIPMKRSGYRKFSNSRIETITDVGNITASYQPGHSHADTFNYEVRIDGKPFIVDTGVSTYEKNARRQYERSTAAHNCVVINGQNSSEVWDGFRIGKRAKVKIISDTDDTVIAEHNGYGAGQIVGRSFHLTDESFIITDSASAGIVYIHLAPNIRLMSVNDNEVITDVAVIRLKDNGFAHKVNVSYGKVSSQYNVFKDNKVIEIHFSNILHYNIIPR